MGESDERPEENASPPSAGKEEYVEAKAPEKTSAVTGPVLACGCLVIIAVGVLAFTVYLVFQGLSFADKAICDAPLDIAALTYNRGDVRALRRKVGVHLRGANAGETQKLMLTPRELTLLVAALRQEGEIPEQGEVDWLNIQIPGDSVRVALSFPMAKDKEEKKYFNVRLSGKIAIRDGNLEVELDSCSVGECEISGLPLRLFQRILLATARKEPNVKRVLSAFRALECSDGLVCVEFDPEKVAELMDKSESEDEQDVEVEE